MAGKTKLIIVESPAKAHTIARFLGRGYRVTASSGHVRDLPKSQIGVDIDNDFEPKYITIRGRGDVLETLRKEAKAASEVLLATDPDREGEAISWHLAQILKIDPASNCRIEFHEITKKAVKEALRHPRPIDMQRVDAQQARRVLDRLVGYKISPLLWVKIKKGLSAGRVQSVATRLVVDREDEIDAFVPREYWTVEAEAECRGQRFAARYAGEPESGEEAEAICERFRKGTLTVGQVRTGEKKKNPQPPFTTPNLQQEASRKLRFTTAKTMQVAQQLYEGVEIKGEGTVGIVTYIRTDSVRTADEAIEAVRGVILDRWGERYLPASPNQYRSRKRAQDAHEAIRPTDVLRRPEAIRDSLTRDQFQLYRLIYQRFVASQMAPAVYGTLTAEIESSEGIALRFSGEQKTFAGYTALYEEGTDDDPETVETDFPQLETGDAVTLADVSRRQHFTSPPPRYTEASLVQALEEKGIGRPSTYAPTITTILARGYVSREQRRLYPTLLGRMVTQVMTEYFPQIADVAFTAGMEDKLDAVEEENTPWKDVVRDFYTPFEKLLEKAETSMEKVKVEDEVSDQVCDLCGAPMVYKMGRFGRFLACSRFPECRGTKPILVEIGVGCPECGAPLLEKTSRKGRKFYGCSRFPDCAFVSWDRPVAEKCPVCGSYMVLKKTRRNTVHLCSNEQCRHRIELPPEAEGDSEE